MKVLVTGADGFIGSKLVEALDDEAEIEKVYAIVWRPTFFEGKKIMSITADLSTSLGLLSNQKIKDTNVVVHLAGSPGDFYSSLHPVNDLMQNTVTLLSVLESVQAWEVKRIVLASTCLIYPAERREGGLPSNYYGLSKRTAEDYLMLFNKKTNIEYTILRMSRVYGPCMVKNPIYDLITNCNNKNINLFCSLDDELDFIYVDDVVRAFCMSILNKKWENRILDISSYQPISIRSLIAMLEDATGKKYEVKGTDLPPRNACLDNREAVKLGWRQKVSMKEGFKRTMEHFCRKEEKNG